MDEILQALKTLAKNCMFKDVTATAYRDELVHDFFFTGLQSSSIRLCLLENSTLDFNAMFTQTRSLDTAQRSSETYVTPNLFKFSTAAATLFPDDPSKSTIAAVSGPKCYFCGNSKHSPHKCPAKEAVSQSCQKEGHFANVCRSNPASTRSEQSILASVYPTLATVLSSPPPTLLKSSTQVTINCVSAKALVDSCS